MESMNFLTHSFGSIHVADYARKFLQHIKRMAFVGAVGPNREEAVKVYQASLASPDTVLSNLTQRKLSELLQGTAENSTVTFSVIGGMILCSCITTVQIFILNIF